jgi:ATP-binding protein involved in chromosome partitioning
MSLAQLAPLTGVVIVTTPHHIAANIAGKSVQLFQRLNTPILVVIENMAGLICPSCGTMTRVFAGLSGEELAERLEVPYLGSIPLDPAISRLSDEGLPALTLNPDSLYTDAYRKISGMLAAQTSIAAMREKPVAKSP